MRPRMEGRQFRQFCEYTRQLRLVRKFRRRLAGHLPEGMGKRRDAGIAEIGSELLDRDIGFRRQLLDRCRDAGALAPALEAQLGLR